MSTVPTTIERLGETALRVVWTDGHESVYPWPLLRAACPCAVCQQMDGGSGLGELPTGLSKHPGGDSPSPLPPPGGGPPLRATAVKPVGRYAIQITWSDGHLTGIYAFDYLRQLCPCEACRPQQFQEG